MTELYDKVKAMAVRFEFKPGERLNELDLARRLQVSRTPLREVLNQLMVEGFLTRAVNRGFIARPLDAQQVHALYEYRVVLETGIARIACERASDEELHALYTYAERSLQLPEDADAERRLQLDEAFHLSLARVTGNEEFVRSLAGVYDRIHFVRWVELQRGPRSHAQSEHLQIVQGLQRRDTDAVVKLLTCHIGRRLDQIVDVIRSGFSTIYMREDASGSADVAL